LHKNSHSASFRPGIADTANANSIAKTKKRRSHCSVYGRGHYTDSQRNSTLNRPALHNQAALGIAAREYDQADC
jgi:hypothetical protein